MLFRSTRIRDLLAAHDLRPSKALGQHFLADPNTARRIVRLADVEPGDRVVEVGPGVGSLTVALLDAGARVTALELDRHIVPVLAEVTAGRVIDIVVGDAEGVVVIPAHLADEVADEALDAVEYEAFVSAHLRLGRSLFGLFPATPDSRIEYERWVARGRPALERGQ